VQGRFVVFTAKVTSGLMRLKFVGQMTAQDLEVEGCGRGRVAAQAE